MWRGTQSWIANIIGVGLFLALTRTSALRGQDLAEPASMRDRSRPTLVAQTTGLAPHRARDGADHGEREALRRPVLRRLPKVDESIRPVSFQQEVAQDELGAVTELVPDAPGSSIAVDNGAALNGFRGRFEGDQFSGSIGPDFYRPGDFDQGIVIVGRDIAMKIGGYTKVDLIYDFNAIESQDLFDTSTIVTNGTDRQNTRFHARQTRFNFDTRWRTDEDPVRVFVEGDFFSEGNRFRLRHAYGELGPVIAGQTWTTFTDVAAAPETLDFEGAVSSVARRQAQVRWTQPLVSEDLSLAIALENPSTIIEVPDFINGRPRTPTPDLVARLRWTRDWGQFQVAGLVRELGFQPEGGPVLKDGAWGLNFTGAAMVTQHNEFYYQILFGDGIGSYRDLPDVTATLEGGANVLGLFGWMVGLTHEWTQQTVSNFTYAQNRLDNPPGQRPDQLRRTDYLAVNLIWMPLRRVNAGIEYLYGTREDVSGAVGAANRLQMAVIFRLD